MATPYVPVPMPIGSSASSFTASRNPRSSSLGSLSASSDSSKGQLEDSNTGTRRQTSAPGQRDSASSVCSTPLLRTKFTNADSCIEYSTRPRESEEQNPEAANLEDRPSTPTILGYEVMEERAKFTVYKIQVKKNPEESWVVFRRYTDFSRLNDKLKEMFPGFRLALPPKRWFKDNYNADFLEDRKLGLQAFLQNLVAHKDIAHCLAVREFLCLDDPPGPFDSLEESRAFCETLEDTNYRFQKELLEKQKEVESLKKLLEHCVQTARSRTGQAPKASASWRWRRLCWRLSQKSRLKSAALLTSRAVSASPKPARRRWKWPKWPTLLRTEPRGCLCVCSSAASRRSGHR
ncbi:sorting nexin-16 isoform X1 [Myotis daubentonii]|uniref:sorting nexin-16 isoform X1 n=1 Tax=Myotis daubentonii TaxID=98922 RepID=UPI002873A39F|nr:sorting nexin-16 isoform X1 [Myotis daubentonii]XP_059528617.1 sorting nexin-16 isoform X1 [Myotis daubentonii]